MDGDATAASMSARGRRSRLDHGLQGGVVDRDTFAEHSLCAGGRRFRGGERRWAPSVILTRCTTGRACWAPAVSSR